MKKLVLLGLLLYNSITFGQKPDTIHVEFVYSDTSCKFNESEVADIFNSKCLKFAYGYVVRWSCMNEYFWADGEFISKRIRLFYYKTLNK